MPYNLSINPGSKQLPPTTRIFDKNTGCSPVGSTDKLSRIMSDIPACFMPMSPGVNRISGTVKRSLPRIKTSSDKASALAPDRTPFLFLRSKEGHGVA